LIGDPAEIANHVAMAHVLFNVALALGLLPFTTQSAACAHAARCPHITFAIRAPSLTNIRYKLQSHHPCHRTRADDVRFAPESSLSFRVRPARRVHASHLLSGPAEPD
jgi:hypothetical protein